MTDTTDTAAVRALFARDFVEVGKLIRASSTRAHMFMVLFSRLSGLGIDDCVARFAQMLADSEARIAADAAAAPATVPRTIHRIWLTNPADPSEPPQEYVAALARAAEDMAPEGWRHCLWVQDPALLPATIATLQAAGGHVAIRTIDESKLAGGARDLFDAFLRDRKFAFAADVARMAILHAEGGFYADLGLMFKDSAYPALIRDTSDYAFIFWDTMFFQNSLMMMPPGSALSAIYLEIAADPYLIPRALIEPASAIREGMAFSGLLVTAILLRIYTPAMRICPLAANANIVFWSAQQSWYTDVGTGEGKYGNAFVPESALSFFRIEGWEGRAPEATHPIFTGAGEG